MLIFFAIRVAPAISDFSWPVAGAIIVPSTNAPINVESVEEIIEK